jgi:hypothetical protein
MNKYIYLFMENSRNGDKWLLIFFKFWNDLIFNFILFVLVYNSSTGGYIVTFTYLLTIFCNYFDPSIFLPHHPPHLQQFQQFQCSIFTHEYKTHPPYLPSFTRLYKISSLPLVTTPGQNLFYLPVLHNGFLYVCVGYFWDRFSWTIFSSWLQTMILLISASPVPDTQSFN